MATNNLDDKYAGLVAQLQTLLATLNTFIHGGPDETVVTDGQVLSTISGVEQQLLAVRYMLKIKDHRLLADAQADTDLVEGMLVRVWGDTSQVNGIYKLLANDTLLKISASQIPTDIGSIDGLSTILNAKVNTVQGLGLSQLSYTADERTKLSGIAEDATFNSSDADLRNRGSHTGTQSADSITDGTTNKAYTAGERTKLSYIASGATVNSADSALRDRSTHTGTQSADSITDGAVNKVYVAADKVKLAGIQPQATQNSTDGFLLDRSHHSGTQDVSTITGLAVALSDFATIEYVDGKTAEVTNFIPIKLSGIGGVGQVLTATVSPGWQGGTGIWTRNGVDIPGATALQYTLTSDGVYTWKDSKVPYIPTGISADVILPGQVTNLVAGVVTRDTIPFTFSAATVGGTPTDYAIEYKTNASSTWIVLLDQVSTSTSGSITGLVAETSYNIRVRAQNALGYGPYSTTLTVSTASALAQTALLYNGSPLLLDGQPLLVDSSLVTPTDGLLLDTFALLLDGVALGVSSVTVPSNGLLLNAVPVFLDSNALGVSN